MRAGGDVAGGGHRASTQSDWPCRMQPDNVADAAGLGAGDPIVISRPSTRDWIQAIVMTGLYGLKSGEEAHDFRLS